MAVMRCRTTVLWTDPHILTSSTSVFTLTGTCISSLSNRYIGAFTNRKEFSSEIIRAGEKCGERVWTFPLDEDFEEDLKSDIADILQVRVAWNLSNIELTMANIILIFCAV